MPLYKIDVQLKLDSEIKINFQSSLITKKNVDFKNRFIDPTSILRSKIDIGINPNFKLKNQFLVENRFQNKKCNLR